MQKLVLFLCLLTILIFCKDSTSTEKTKVDIQEHLIKGDWDFITTRNKMWNYGFSEGKFTSEGHRFKIFRAGDKYSTAHDPECPKCLNLSE